METRPGTFMGAYEWITGNAPRRCLDNGSLLVSGAYPRKGPKVNKIEEFAIAFGKRAAENDASLVSGNGPTIGNALVSGIQSVVKSEVFQYITIIPFKQHGTISSMTHAERSEYFYGVRQELISRANIVVFISGEKLNNDGQIVNSDTVYTEYSQAMEASRFAIPIAILGGSAAVIHERMRLEIKKKVHVYRDLPEGLFDRLANADLSNSEIIDVVFEIANWLVENKLASRSRRSSISSRDGRHHQRTVSGSSTHSTNSAIPARLTRNPLSPSTAASSRQASYSAVATS